MSPPPPSLLLIIFTFLPILILVSTQSVQLLSSSADNLSLVSGLTARFQCSVYRCGPSEAKPPSLCWYKDDILLFNGTEFEPESGVEPSRIILQRSIDSENIMQPNGASSCIGEEFTLLLRNLSLPDSGRYSCQLLWAKQPPQQLDFKLDVIEGQMKLNFSNLGYDHTECCIERGLSPLCRPMCRPRDMGDEFFDPTSCQVEDYKNFLHCATDGGRRDYLSCCRQKAIPSFCFDFCSNNFQSMKKSHRLCLYYLPEIFDCFSRQFALQPPPAPIDVQLKEGKGGPKLCWKWEKPAMGAEEANGFTVHLREMPGMEEEAINFQSRTKRRTAAIPLEKIQSITLMQEMRPMATNLHRKQQQQQLLSTINIPAKSIEWLPNSSTLCVPIGNSLRNGIRYLIHVQSTNDYGISEPSRPIFINEDGQMHRT